MELTPHPRPAARTLAAVGRASPFPPRLALLLGLLPALLGMVSCGGPQRPVRSEVPGYEALRDELGGFDFTPLRGRRIVLDPGHGGVFRGAVGLNGLEEADVNLGVALYLRGLLEWAGAEVHLTRAADCDLLTPADSSLTADLAARVAIVDSLRPDVFVSIHHNSNVQLDRDLNETQTYYPVGRDGADLDLARAVHRYLVRNLGISPAKIMAGNFHVLRNSPVPAILGEPSMISNPEIERRLGLAAKQELEAQAYFLGLREYFAGGTPSFVAARPETLAAGAPPPGGTLYWRFESGGPGAPSLDPASIRLTVDGRPRPFTLSPDGRTVGWRPTRADRLGERRLELRARNLRGRATPVLTLRVPGLPGTDFRSEIVYEHAGGDEPRRALFAWESLDPAPDGLPRLSLVRLGDGGRREAVADLPATPGSRGWLMLPGSALWPPDDRASGLAICRRDTSDGPAGEPCAPLAPALGDCRSPWRLLTLAPPDDGEAVGSGAADALWVPRLLPEAAPGEAPGPPPRPDVPVLAVRAGEPFWLEAAGVVPLFGDAEHREPWAGPSAAPPETLRWRALLPELVGRRIVLDPTGGGSETDGAGPLGTRGADLNLRVAEMTAALLRGAGAEATLTREDERWIPPEEKVKLTNDLPADLFLTIGRAPPGVPLAVHHHHGSRAGGAWAKITARAAHPLLAAGDTVTVAPSYAYLLRHTACPALAVGLEAPADMAAELRLAEPSCQQAQARTLFLGIAALLAGEELLDRTVQPGALLRGNAARTLPPSRIDWVRWDGNLLWLPPRWSTSPPDTVSYLTGPGLPAVGDEHTLEIHAGPSWQFWALRRAPDAVWTWKLLLENR